MSRNPRPLRWQDLPVERRRRLGVLVSGLIRQRLSADREAGHEHGSGLPRSRIPDKIRARHCERQAVVYVRQSTVRQVEQNRESTRLQYGLADRACRLGWRREQIMVIDDDLGRSAASALNRLGFQRLVAEVGLGHVGLVLGIEVSRLARSCRDWHQLLEMCALFDTLIGDAGGIYDPSTYNDRLLLGLKGTMSEAELHILKARMHEGRRAKAARGELVLGLPRGYVLKPSGEVALDPHEGVQQVIRLVFAIFERRRSVSGVLRYLVDHDIWLVNLTDTSVRTSTRESS